MRSYTIDQGPESRWRYYLEPPRIESWAGRWTINGHMAAAEQVQWFIARRQQADANRLLDWTAFPLVPGLDEALDDLEVRSELGTAEIPLEEIVKRYTKDENGNVISRYGDLEEERPVPFDQIVDDAGGSLRTAWAHVEIPFAEDHPLGRWIGRAKPQIGQLVSYYAVAHKMVYADREVAVFGEVVQSRFAPFGRGDAYVEVRHRMKQAEEESDQEIEWVAVGMKVISRFLV